MDLLKFIGRRLIFLVFLLWGVATCVFILSNLVSDPLVANLSQRNLNNPQIVAAFQQKWGLDQPLYVQYGVYLKNLLHGDMGISIRTSRSVGAELMRYFPATLELGFFAIIFASFFGILFGVVSATKRNSWLDQCLRAVSVTGVSVPSFWFAMIMLYVFYMKLGWAKGPGRISSGFLPPTDITGFYVLDSLLAGNIPMALDCLGHLLLPAIVLGAFTMGLITRTTRSNLLEVMSTDYIRTARAKGVPGRLLMTRHALGNALIPVLTVIGLGLGNLLGGMVLVETIFSWPGIGQYAYQSVTSLDFPSITGVSLLIAMNYVVINLVVDLLYGIIDPRVRYK
ncbi:MAG: ABC transporter permease [Clostridiales bacterium]